MKPFDQKPRGFSCVGLISPKTPENVGAVMRACYAYGAAQLNISQSRAAHVEDKTNTPKAHRHMPTFFVDNVLNYIPYGADVVAVDLVEGATPLPTFTHPERAFYVFGPEDGTISDSVLQRASYRVSVPTQCCMNLAASVNVVLYDRLAKRGKFENPFAAEPKSKRYERNSQ